MSNDKRDEFEISVIDFRSPVNIGSQNTLQWIASRDGKTSSGTSTATDRRDQRVVEILYVTPTVQHMSRVPYENVNQIIRIKRAVAE